MADTPADHPAVAGPKAALVTAPVLAAPGVLAPVKATPQVSPAQNEMERVLRKLFPDGSMHKVKVKTFADLKNPLVLSVGYSAWTQSSTLIYYDEKTSEDAMPFVLFHEASHVVQFRKDGDRYPATFEKMLAHEMKSYPDTEAWIRSKAAKKFYLDNDLDGPDWLFDTAEATTAAVALVYFKCLGRLLARYAQRTAAGLIRPIAATVAETIAPAEMLRDHIFLKNMASAEFVAKIRNDQYFKTDDMYREGKSQKDKKRFKDLGYAPVE